MKAQLSTVLATVFAACVSATAAQAQASRTWVSGVGDDVNPCSRTAPCKTFAGAISKTAANGIINCLDPGGFGAVTITKSITIDCTGTFAGILASGVNGVNVNGAGIIVTLRGISIEGFSTAQVGINFINGAALHVEDCRVFQFRSGTAFGLKFAPPAGVAGELFVKNSTFANNGTGSTGGGIQIKPVGTGTARVVIENSSIQNNVFGIAVDGTGSTGGMNVTVRNSTISGGSQHGVVATTPPGGAPMSVMFDQSGVINNSTGVSALGTGVSVRIGASVITGNSTGVTVGSGGSMVSYKTNQIDGNANNGTPITGVALN